jgi:hypothetical protein
MPNLFGGGDLAAFTPDIAAESPSTQARKIFFPARICRLNNYENSLIERNFRPVKLSKPTRDWKIARTGHAILKQQGAFHSSRCLIY